MSWLSSAVSGIGEVATGIGNVITGKAAANSARAANQANIDQTAANNATQIALAQQANTFSAGQVQQQEDFQERMSDTSYQRATADMKAAGINPMLAIDNGGASTPSGSAASATMADTSAPHILPVPSGMSGLIGNAKDIISMYTSLKTALADTALAKAKTLESGASTASLNAGIPAKKFEGNFFQFLNGVMDNLSQSSAWSAAKGIGRQMLRGSDSIISGANNYPNLVDK